MAFLVLSDCVTWSDWRSASADDSVARAAAAGQEVCRGYTADPEAIDGPRCVSL